MIILVTALYAHEQGNDVYIHAADQKPRITGGPDSDSPMWKCLRTELGTGSSDGDKDDKGDKGDGGSHGASTESSP